MKKGMLIDKGIPHAMLFPSLNFKRCELLPLTHIDRIRHHQCDRKLCA